jgi:hypothetical protein
MFKGLLIDPTDAGVRADTGAVPAGPAAGMPAGTPAAAPAPGAVTSAATVEAAALAARQAEWDRIQQAVTTGQGLPPRP